MLAAVRGHITDQQLTAGYALTLKENDMHLRLITRPTFGDIGIEEEEWEVVPLETETPAPVEAPVPSAPVPA